MKVKHSFGYTQVVRNRLASRKEGKEKDAMFAQKSQFSPIVPHIQLSDGEIHFYQKEGYLLLPGLLTEENAQLLQKEVEDILQPQNLGTSKLMQSSDHLVGSQLESLINSVELRSIAGQLMGGPSTLYLPFTAVKTPGGGRFHFHQDNQYTRFDGPGINLWFSLSSMSPENGCLQVVPRSHQNGTLGAQLSGDGDQHKKILWEPNDFLPLRMRPGDCVAFSRLTVHGSGPNSTETIRWAYAVQFHRDDVRAVWENNQEPVFLKEHPRFSIRPLQKLPIQQTNHESLDGH